MMTKLSSSLWSTLTVLSMIGQMAEAQGLPTVQVLPADQVEAIVQACAQNADVKLSDDLDRSIHATYFDVQARKDANSIGPFLARMPPPDRGVALRLFDCLSKNLLQSSDVTGPPSPLQPLLTTQPYRVCSGEFEERCGPHEVYLYCYTDVRGWAEAHCSSFSVNRSNNYGGNRCGYTMDLVECTGPKGLRLGP